LRLPLNPNIEFVVPLLALARSLPSSWRVFSLSEKAGFDRSEFLRLDELPVLGLPIRLWERDEEAEGGSLDDRIVTLFESEAGSEGSSRSRSRVDVEEDVEATDVGVPEGRGGGGPIDVSRSRFHPLSVAALDPIEVRFTWELLEVVDRFSPDTLLVLE
jgi:hypothetical protein